LKFSIEIFNFLLKIFFIVKNRKELEELSSPLKAEYVHWIAESEELDGYKKPEIQLIFCSSTMDCLFKFKCEEQKLREPPYEKLKPFFEGGLYQDEEEFAKILDQQGVFRPPGTQVMEYTESGGKKFKVKTRNDFFKKKSIEIFFYFSFFNFLKEI